MAADGASGKRRRGQPGGGGSLPGQSDTLCPGQRRRCSPGGASGRAGWRVGGVFAVAARACRRDSAGRGSQGAGELTWLLTFRDGLTRAAMVPPALPIWPDGMPGGFRGGGLAGCPLWRRGHRAAALKGRGNGREGPNSGNGVGSGRGQRETEARPARGRWFPARPERHPLTRPTAALLTRWSVGPGRVAGWRAGGPKGQRGPGQQGAGELTWLLTFLARIDQGGAGSHCPPDLAGLAARRIQGRRVGWVFAVAARASGGSAERPGQRARGAE